MMQLQENQKNILTRLTNIGGIISFDAHVGLSPEICMALKNIFIQCQEIVVAKFLNLFHFAKYEMDTQANKHCAKKLS